MSCDLQMPAVQGHVASCDVSQQMTSRLGFYTPLPQAYRKWRQVIVRPCVLGQITIFNHVVADLRLV